MASKWRKAKQALGLNLCYYVHRKNTVEADDSQAPAIDSYSGAAFLSRPAPAGLSSPPATPARTGSAETTRRKLSKSPSTPTQKTCSICLAAVKPGKGHAIFTAECSHSFHFHCITSNIRHGNLLCPVCRAKWKEIPLQGPDYVVHPGPGRTRGSIPAAAGWPFNNDAVITVPRRLPPPRPNYAYPRPMMQFPGTEPALFDDDEPVNQQEGITQMNTSKSLHHLLNSVKTIDIRSYPEVSSIPRKKSWDGFSILVHLKAVVADASMPRTSESVNNGNLPYGSPRTSSRTPVDLVTVLDISGSMAGTKLALLKRAMGFVIQNLSSDDRLSLVVFSSASRRLFPLRLMTESGRQQALEAVNALVATGGTNIADGLRKAAKVMEERREKNPVSSIVLLSDGQDTCTVKISGGSGNQPEPNYQSLLPSSSGFRIPVHTFGFGRDHDATSMHSIAETSGGTFSFIEMESTIQDAFAQCVGGLLSVAVQHLQVGFECVHPGLRVRAVKAGSYPSRLMADGRTGCVGVGDLYADEERDFLINVNVPTELSGSETPLLKLRCIFRHPITKEMVTLEGEEVKVTRPETVEREVVSLEVDRHRNRLRAAEAMSEARVAAEDGDLARAVSVLECCREMLSRTVSAKCQDRLSVTLDAELKEMQERMASRQVYESSGRAYILSGLSSHSWQRATARGDSTDSSSISASYQTPSMVDMITRSQASFVRSPTTQRLVHRSPLSF